MVWHKIKNIAEQLGETIPGTVKEAVPSSLPNPFSELLPKDAMGSVLKAVQLPVIDSGQVGKALSRASGALPDKIVDLGLVTEAQVACENLSGSIVESWNNLPSISAASIAASLTSDDFRTALTSNLTAWAESALGKVPDSYDKALDAAYNASHIGGKYHRLFDGSHDPLGAWQKITEAGLGDSFTDKVGGYAQALTKDFVTTMGLPFATLDKVHFDQMVATWSVIPGVDRDYLYRLFSLNAADLVGTALSSVGIVLSLRSGNFQRFAEVVGSLGVSAIANANPVLALVTIASTGYAYALNPLSFADMGVGACTAVMSILLHSVISLPFFIELVVVTAIVNVVKTNILCNSDLRDYVMATINTQVSGLDITPSFG